MDRAIYSCSDYHGYKNVLFFMEPAEVKYRNSLQIEGLIYTLITEAESMQGIMVTGCNKKQYKVYADYSVKALR